jgi:DNA-binding transcriptional MerR regulator
MEVATDVAARLLGISEKQLQRYGDGGVIEYRPHGLRGRRRYDLNYLRTVAPTLNLRFDEKLAQQLTKLQ